MQEEFTFTHCRLWFEDRFEPGKIAISDSHIIDIGDFPGIKGREIPCKGMAVFPALIDNHVHFREPGAEHKEDFRTGSAAAAHGGTGTVLEVQNSLPLLTHPDLVRAKRQIIAEKSVVKVGLYASATPSVLSNLREMAELTSGLKLFMAPSHGDEGVEDEESIRPFFRATAELGFPLIIHAEDGAVIRGESEKYGAMGPAFFSKARPPLAEIAAVEKGLQLAGEYGTSLHVFHVSTAGAVDLILDARKRGVDVTCSTCPHYLFFTEEDVAKVGGVLKVYPSIKAAHDKTRLLEAILEDDIQIISTDHAPHQPTEKTLPFDRAPAGISSSDLLLPLLSTLVARKAMAFGDVMRLCVLNPAKIHSLWDRGGLQAGNLADLVLFDPQMIWTPREEDFLSKASISPYIGMELTGRVAATLVEGKPAYLDKTGPLSDQFPNPD